jgi:hypothetical protein
MATNSNWTIVFEDKIIIKNNGEESGIGYVIDDNSFWSKSKFSNIWAIQYGTTISSDEVEYRDTTPHSTFVDADIGAIEDFINRWDSAHLVKLQADWDNNNAKVEDPVDSETYRDETQAEKIIRLGERPTSYSS